MSVSKRKILNLTLSNAVHKCDADIRSGLMSNVILTGGNSLLPGFSDRLQAELQKKAGPALRFKLLNTNQGIQATTEKMFK